MTGKPVSHNSRSGFTLIELMIVIVIIAVLASLLLPAVNSVITSARLAEAQTEIASIETSIADFKGKFGKVPPSKISFVRVGSPPKLPPTTKAILRSMFPQIRFDGPGGALQTSLANAGLLDQTLFGPEALVFFLGGVRKFNDKNGNGIRDPGELTNVLVGFSKNPANPFAQPVEGQANRIGPLFEFDTARLIGLNRDADPSTPKVLAYLGTLEGQTKPLVYVSTARTKSYVATDAGLPQYTPPGGGTPVDWTPYYKTPSPDPSFYNPTTFQIISPGYDGRYGKGGLYNDNTAPSLADSDNLTNFAGGILGG